MRSRSGGLVVAALALLTAAPARAFCRTTTCQPGDAAAPCSTDSNGCLVGGEPLFWAGACVSYSVQRDGSPLRGIRAEDAELAVGAGFSSWMGAACAEGGSPSLGVTSRGLVSCDRQEYSSSHGNANVWMFRDDDWPYDDTGATLALTTVTYNRRTGEIYDADVEVNSHDNEITLGDGRIAFDFLSIATHEAGHFLGLSHNPRDPGATMTPGYFQGTVELRTLGADDVAGICAIYPPGRSAGRCDDTPRHGYSTVCAGDDEVEGCTACASAPGRADQRPWPVALAAAAALGAALRRRRRATP